MRNYKLSYKLGLRVLTQSWWVFDLKAGGVGVLP